MQEKKSNQRKQHIFFFIVVLLIISGSSRNADLQTQHSWASEENSRSSKQTHQAEGNIYSATAPCCLPEEVSDKNISDAASCIGLHSPKVKSLVTISKLSIWDGKKKLCLYTDKKEVPVHLPHSSWMHIHCFVFHVSQGPHYPFHTWLPHILWKWK